MFIIFYAVLFGLGYLINAAYDSFIHFQYYRSHDGIMQWGAIWILSTFVICIALSYIPKVHDIIPRIPILDNINRFIAKHYNIAMYSIVAYGAFGYMIIHYYYIPLVEIVLRDSMFDLEYPMVWPDYDVNIFILGLWGYYSVASLIATILLIVFGYYTAKIVNGSNNQWPIVIISAIAIYVTYSMVLFSSYARNIIVQPK